eukprot:jgi/Chrzof1/10751/Cz05g10310.t1
MAGDNPGQEIAQPSTETQAPEVVVQEPTSEEQRSAQRESTPIAPPKELYIDAKWDNLIDLTLRRGVYGTLAGGLAGLLLFSEYERTRLIGWPHAS